MNSGSIIVMKISINSFLKILEISRLSCHEPKILYKNIISCHYFVGIVAELIKGPERYFTVYFYKNLKKV